MVRALAADEVAQTAEVLAEAFFDYPVMRFVLDRESKDYGSRLRRLIEFFVTARVLRRELILGVGAPGDLRAVAMISRPDRESPPDLAEHRERLWRQLGGAARSRYETFGAACAPFQTDVPHVHLSMIGVRRSSPGQGLGRLLLEEVHRRSAEDPDSRGVSLTTEEEANVGLYEHFGYEIVGRVAVTPDLTTWGLFRPDS